MSALCRPASALNSVRCQSHGLDRCSLAVQRVQHSRIGGLQGCGAQGCRSSAGQLHGLALLGELPPSHPYSLAHLLEEWRACTLLPRVRTLACRLDHAVLRAQRAYMDRKGASNFADRRRGVCRPGKDPRAARWTHMHGLLALQMPPRLQPPGRQLRATLQCRWPPPTIRWSQVLLLLATHAACMQAQCCPRSGAQTCRHPGQPSPTAPA